MPPKAKVSAAVIPDTPRLNHAEQVTMLLAERDLQLAMQSDKLAQATLRAQELEAHIAITATRQAAQDVKASFKQAQEKHQRLAEHLGAKYGVNWSEVSFDAETGDIVDLPKA